MPDSFMPGHVTSTGQSRPLSGRVAVVTGSTSGIGLGILEQLAAAGANVAMNGLGDAVPIEAKLERIRRDHEVAAIYVPANLMDPKDCSRLVAAAAEQLGDIDILVNNAGIQHVAPIERFPSEKWD